MINNSKKAILKYTFCLLIYVTIASLFTNCSDLENIVVEEQDPDNEEEPTDDVVEYASVFDKLKKGVNQDANLPSSGVWVRIQHHPGHMQAIKEAGFESVRIFLPYGSNNISEFESRIQDALDNDLTVVVCMWGSNSWNGNINSGITQIADRWRTLAQTWVDFPNDVVFEILNETKGIGFREASSYPNVMKLYNAAITAIREVDPDRPILVGPPGYNDSDKLDPWVSEEHLTYTLSDGSGFFEDPNIGVSIHFYRPNGGSGNNFAMGTEPLNPGWEPSIDYEINAAVDWQNTYNTKMPVVVTEWGCWLFDSRSESELKQWLQYHLDSYNEHNFGSMWYTGIQSNQRHFGIFDSELGWNSIVLSKLTGVISPIIPSTPQLLDSEFFTNSQTWNLTSTQVTKHIIQNNADVLNGKSSVKIIVNSPVDCQMYQQSLGRINNTPPAPGRTLLHLLQGETYEISFMAKTESGQGEVKIALKDVNNLNTVFYESDVQVITTTGQTFTMSYTHSVATALDVRFEFDVGAKAQTLILDKVILIRDE